MLALRTQIPWRDLVPLRPLEKTWELTLPLPWLVASLYLYHGHWPLLAGIASFFFFLTGLRLSHNCQHYALGIPKIAHDLVLAGLSLLMLTSMHAVQVTHLHHHRHCLDDEDIEAGHAGYPWWRVLLTGPWFPIHLHLAALRLGNREKRLWIAAELIAIVLWFVAILLLPIACLHWHLAAVAVGECFTGFFAVWIVHHGCDHHTIARTQRGWLKNVVSYAMFYHLEHHLFPAVPTSHLPELARRLDQKIPNRNQKMVF
jgi:fatty acid desaturase